MANKRIVFSAIPCTCGNCLAAVPQGSAIWYEGRLSDVEGCPKCDPDCQARQQAEDAPSKPEKP